MPDFVLTATSTLLVEFARGGDLMVKLISLDDKEGKQVAGTFLYGSGKMGMMKNSTPVEDSLVHLFAPLARGEKGSVSTETVTNKFLRFATPRPNDHVVVSADAEGDLTLRIEGQDMGFPSTVETRLLKSEMQTDAACSVFAALQQLLKGYGEPV